jgi:hypothetical protein
MLYHLEIWIVGVVLSLPVLVLGLAWARVVRLRSDGSIQRRQRVFYLVALAAVSVSTVAYLGYWSWRICTLYRVELSFTSLLVLERSIYACRLLSLVAIACLLIGRGPHRVLLIVTTLWVMLQLWVHDGIIHWA